MLYYNVASDKTAFVNRFGAEPSNVLIYVEPEADTRELLSRIEQMDHVRKVNLYDLAGDGGALPSASLVQTSFQGGSTMLLPF